MASTTRSTALCWTCCCASTRPSAIRWGFPSPFPATQLRLIEAIFEGLLLKENAGFDAQFLPGFEEYMKPQQLELDLQWENAADREKRSRTMFAQQTIKVDEVAAELNAARTAVGSGIDVAAFMKDAARMYHGVVSENGAVSFDLTESPRGLREVIDRRSSSLLVSNFR